MPDEPARSEESDDAAGSPAPGRPVLPIRIWVTGVLLAVFGVAIIINLVHALADQGDRSWTTEAIFAAIWVALVAAFAREVRRDARASGRGRAQSP